MLPAALRRQRLLLLLLLLLAASRRLRLPGAGAVVDGRRHRRDAPRDLVACKLIWLRRSVSRCAERSLPDMQGVFDAWSSFADCSV